MKRIVVAAALTATILATLLALDACEKPSDRRSPAPAVKPATPTAAPPAPTAALPVAPVAPPPNPLDRPNAPSAAQCEQYAQKAVGFVAESMTPPGATDDQRAAVLAKLGDEHDKQLAFCVAAIEVKEVECVIAATDFTGLADCERWRRQVPDKLASQKDVDAADCERFFVRYKQFMVQDGVPPDRIDKDKDQLERTCLDKAKPSTLACFITAHTYVEAKRCP